MAFSGQTTWGLWSQTTRQKGWFVGTFSSHASTAGTFRSRCSAGFFSKPGSGTSEICDALEGEDCFGAEVGLAGLGGAVAEVLEVVRQRADVGPALGLAGEVVGVGAVAEGHQAGVEDGPRGHAGGRARKRAAKEQALAGEAVYVGRADVA